MPATKPVRRSQLISPFGIGSMVDFPRDESLMPAGLDAWSLAKEECPVEAGWIIREERLEARLSTRDRPVTHLRMPPDHRDPDGGAPFANENVPFVRFPRWHYCHHCGGMELLSLFSATRQRCAGRPYQGKSCEKWAASRRPFLIPVRFVAVCELGHIQDFPFMEWVHRDKAPIPECRLRLRAGRSSAGLSGITIECSCDQKRALGDVFRYEEQTGGPLSTQINQRCRGMRPWLGEDEDSPTPGCLGSGHLRVLQRGASNVYFPHVVSSIYLPLWAEEVSGEIAALLEQPSLWTFLQQRTEGGEIDSAVCEIVAATTGVDPGRLKAAADRKLRGAGVTVAAGATGDEEDFRRSEYEAISEGKVGPQAELYSECVPLEDYDPAITRLFSRIRLVHKLRETRALTGFTRILPPDGDLAAPRLQKLVLDPAIDWLPAVKVYGEGIFLDLNQAEIARWAAEFTRSRPLFSQLSQRYNAARTKRQQALRVVTPKFVLLHTLAHVLINQLSFDCGYGSASLRERLYCDFTDPSRPMQGLLIYTASGDSEGTMGGLVRQGRPRRLEMMVRKALNHALWCSSDPVCIESRGQGSDSTNLAACHGCTLLPETSCEEGNRLLDRAVLVGTPERPEAGFFAQLLVRG